MNRVGSIRDNHKFQKNYDMKMRKATDTKVQGLAVPNLLITTGLVTFRKCCFGLKNAHQLGASCGCKSSTCPAHSTSVLYYVLHSPPSQFSSNPVFLNSIRIWSQFRKHFGLHTTLIRSPFKISVLNNSIRNISLQDVRRQWEGELGEEVTEDQWETAPNLVHTSSQS